MRIEGFGLLKSPSSSSHFDQNMNKLLNVFLLLSFCCLASASNIPQLNIVGCPNPVPSPYADWSKYDLSVVSNYTLDDGSGQYPTESTVGYLCHDKSNIYVKFYAQDHDMYNPYTTCDSPLYQYDALEMFISYGSATPQYYLEIEVAPSNTLFLSSINNPSGNCTNFTGDELTCDSISFIAQEASGYWWAYLQVPLSLIESVSAPSSGTTYRADFYRIDYTANQSKQYSCWSPTYQSPACFHVPQYFGYLYLE